MGAKSSWPTSDHTFTCHKSGVNDHPVSIKIIFVQHADLPVVSFLNRHCHYRSEDSQIPNDAVWEPNIYIYIFIYLFIYWYIYIDIYIN